MSPFERPTHTDNATSTPAAIDTGLGRGLSQASELLGDPDAAPEVLRQCLLWLHAETTSTSTPRLVGPAELREWVTEPVDHLETLVESRRARATLRSLRHRLIEDLSGRILTVEPLHGPVRPERWWLTDDLGAVLAVDDWETRGETVRGTEAVRFLLAARRAQSGSGGYYAAIADVLERGWRREEWIALDIGHSLLDEMDPRSLLLLAWLSEVRMGSNSSDASPRCRRQVTDLLERINPEARATPSEPDRLPLTYAPVDHPAAAPSARRRAAVRSADALETARTRLTGRRNRRKAALLTFGGLTLSCLLWLGGTYGIDPAAMTDLGLVSILRPTAFLALGAILALFGRELCRPEPTTWRLTAPLVAFVAVIHGTPSVLYGTLRYSWAWKHLGIIDYIERTGTVDPDAKVMAIYHNWPGFFALNAALARLFGLDNAVQIARWWPVVVNLAVIPALLFVYRGIRPVGDQRPGWLAVGLFLLANWIGQDYFSPQSLAFLLFLVVIGVVLRIASATQARHEDRSTIWLTGMALLAAAAMVTSHQITPIVLLVALGALTLTRSRRALTVLGGVAAMAALWAATGALSYVSENLTALGEGLGQPVQNADQNLVDQAQVSSGQVLVSSMGRLTVVAIALLAIVGVAQQLKRRQLDRTALALMLSPAALMFANSFGGEIGFRAYLFALPFLAWFGAMALWPRQESEHRRPIGAKRGLAIVLAMLVLLSGFLFGYYGKDAWYHFSGDEVAASDLVLRTGSPGSLLVTVTTNYPGQWENYENFTYVPIATEPADGRDRLIEDPAAVLAGWLGGEDYTDGYVLVTASQTREVEALGTMPPGSVERIIASLESSPQFRTLYDTPDAKVFVLAR